MLALALLGRAAQRAEASRRELAWLTVFAAAIWISDPFVLYFVGGPAAFVALLDAIAPARRRRGGHRARGARGVRGGRVAVPLRARAVRRGAPPGRGRGTSCDRARRPRRPCSCRLRSLRGAPRDERLRPHVGARRCDRHGVAAPRPRRPRTGRRGAHHPTVARRVPARTHARRVRRVDTDRGDPRQRVREPRDRHRSVPRRRARRDRGPRRDRRRSLVGSGRDASRRA